MATPVPGLVDVTETVVPTAAPPRAVPSNLVTTEQVARQVPAPVPAAEPEYTRKAREIFLALGGVDNAFAPLRQLTTVADAHRLHAVASEINADAADEVLVRFYEVVAETLRAQPPHVRAYFEALPDDWYAESPLYYTYPHSVGVADGQRRGTLEDLRRQLPALREAGFRNLQLLPHWRSPGGDGGYDISGFEVDPSLGGEAAFRALMDEAMRLGIRIITDFIPNHISVRHPWFEAVLQGDESRLSWFLVMDDAELVGTETDEKGKLRVLLKRASGVVDKPWAIFPHASKKNLIEIEVNGKKHQVFHSFYPFQVDLNLRHPEVLGELFKVLGWEANLGVAGKRMDAAPHWYKEDGTNYENLRGTHALQELFKLFYRHVVHKGITVPEVGEGLEEASGYFGLRTAVLGKESNAEGDAMFGFEWNSTMWGTLLDENPELFWTFCDKLARLSPHTFWFNLGRHHDEMRTDLMPAGVRERVEAKLLARGALMFAGRGVGGRMADFLEKDPRQIAKAFWLNFMPPGGTPVVYYGDEIGAVNQPAYMEEEQRRRLPILKELGFPTHDPNVALDTRDIGRGPVSASAFEAARAAGYLPLVTLKALTQLWATRSSLRRGQVFRLSVDAPKVLALAKWARGEDGPLVGLCNLSGEEVPVRLQAAELREKLNHGEAGALGLRDVLGAALGEPVRLLTLEREASELRLVLPPHEHLLLELAAVPSAAQPP